MLSRLWKYIKEHYILSIIILILVILNILKIIIVSTIIILTIIFISFKMMFDKPYKAPQKVVVKVESIEEVSKEARIISLDKSIKEAEEKLEHADEDEKEDLKRTIIDLKEELYHVRPPEAFEKEKLIPKLVTKQSEITQINDIIRSLQYNIDNENKKLNNPSLSADQKKYIQNTIDNLENTIVGYKSKLEL